MTSKSATLSMTIDVEDFYDGMAVLGHDVPRPPASWKSWPNW